MTHSHRHGSTEVFLICMAVILFTALSYVLSHNTPQDYDTGQIMASQYPSNPKTYCFTIAGI